ncbi:Putative bifunctional P-450/NADPH-P450 reductase 1 [Durusdinium trenchii]|uniref:Bifunctional P-450/NADPH-P450 reductase 1 n=1 Tax=Durusdinium trenchii TaxID=1381693 RepID=A0ABP0NZA3_9DINO
MARLTLVDPDEGRLSLARRKLSEAEASDGSSCVSCIAAAVHADGQPLPGSLPEGYDCILALQAVRHIVAPPPHYAAKLQLETVAGEAICAGYARMFAGLYASVKPGGRRSSPNTATSNTLVLGIIDQLDGKAGTLVLSLDQAMAFKELLARAAICTGNSTRRLFSEDGSEIFGLDDLRRLHEASEKPKCRVNLKEGKTTKGRIDLEVVSTDGSDFKWKWGSNHAHYKFGDLMIRPLWRALAGSKPSRKVVHPPQPIPLPSTGNLKDYGLTSRLKTTTPIATPKPHGRPELPTDLSLLEASSQVEEIAGEEALPDVLDPLEEGDRSIGCTMEEMVLPSFESFRSWEVPLSGEPPRMPNRMLHEYHLYRLRGALKLGVV